MSEKSDFGALWSAAYKLYETIETLRPVSQEGSENEPILKLVYQGFNATMVQLLRHNLELVVLKLDSRGKDFSNPHAVLEISLKNGGKHIRIKFSAITQLDAELAQKVKNKMEKMTTYEMKLEYLPPLDDGTRGSALERPVRQWGDNGELMYEQFQKLVLSRRILNVYVCNYTLFNVRDSYQHATYFAWDDRHVHPTAITPTMWEEAHKLRVVVMPQPEDRLWIPPAYTADELLKVISDNEDWSIMGKYVGSEVRIGDAQAKLRFLGIEV